MFKHKNIACFFFFIFSLFWSPCAHTMDNDDDMLKFLPGSGRSVLDNSEAERPSITIMQSPPSEEQNLLEKLYGRTVSGVRVPESARQIISGIASLVPLFPTGQVFVPLSLIGLLSLGLTPNIIPDVGWESWALVGAVGTPIVMPTLIGTYSGASNFFKLTSPEVIETQEKVFERPYSRLESWSQSYLTQFVEFAFWGSLFFALLMDTESRVTGWGDYHILGGIFGTLSVIAVYFILIRASNNINRYSYRHYTNQDEEEQKEASLAPIEATKEHIKYKGLNSVEAQNLAQQLNIIEIPLPVNPMQRVINRDSFAETESRRSSALLLEERNGSLDSISETQDFGLPLPHADFTDELAKPQYQKALEKMMAIEKIIPSWIKNWNTWSTKISKYSSRMTQLGSIPAQELIAFALPFSLFTYLAAPAPVTWGVSIVAAGIYTLCLPGITVRENALIWKEHEQLLRLYKPQVTCGYFGERIAPFVARGGTLLYFTFPVTDFIRNSLLNNVIGITNVPAQICILLPLMAGIGLAGPGQFLDRTYTTLSNWFATGGPVALPCYNFKLFHFFHGVYYYLFRYCCCADDNGRAGALEPLKRYLEDREHALELVERLQEMENNTFQLNSKFTKFLTEQLGITPPSQEGSSLLTGNGTL